MAGIWIFNEDGTVRWLQGDGPPHAQLVYKATEEVIISMEMLEQKLASLGWEKHINPLDHEGDPHKVFFKRGQERYTITIPSEFSKLRSTHMFDIAVQTRNAFTVNVLVGF